MTTLAPPEAFRSAFVRTGTYHCEFTARCPKCGEQATWHAETLGSDKTPYYTILCPCGKDETSCPL